MSTTRESQDQATKIDAERQEAIEAAPFVSVTIQSSGIHPSTSRMITIDVVTLSPTLEPVETFHAVLDSKGDPGPFHLHGVSEEEFATAKRFGQILKSLDRLIDGRTLLIHNATRGWGFIVSEAKRAMNDAARANRNNNRGNRRGGRGRRRQRVGHIPRPVVIIDTLASVRRQAIILDDVRIRGVAHALGLKASPAEASVERTLVPHRELCREETLLVGLQRSIVRVQAQEATPTLVNPGTYEPGKTLISGMEVVVAPEIEMDPDIIIQACVDADLFYSEKLTRQTSVVVCNQTRDIDGKAMHAQRKGIPLLSDVAFLAAVKRVKEGKKLDVEKR